MWWLLKQLFFFYWNANILMPADFPFTTHNDPSNFLEVPHVFQTLPWFQSVTSESHDAINQVLFSCSFNYCSEKVLQLLPQEFDVIKVWGLWKSSFNLFWCLPGRYLFERGCHLEKLSQNSLLALGISWKYFMPDCSKTWTLNHGSILLVNSGELNSFFPSISVFLKFITLVAIPRGGCWPWLNLQVTASLEIWARTWLRPKGLFSLSEQYWWGLVCWSEAQESAFLLMC